MYRRDHWRKGITARDIEELIDIEVSLSAYSSEGGTLEDLQAGIDSLREIVCKLATLFPEEAVLKLFPEWSKESEKLD